MVVGSTEERELQVHFQAYLTLFEAVLAKKEGDPDRRRLALLQLKEFLFETVHNSDEFVNHLPECARMIGVPEKSLSVFIGANFLKAFQQAKRKLEKEPPSQLPDDAPFDSVMEEAQAKTGFLFPPGARFVPYDAGFLKLLLATGEEMLPKGAETVSQLSDLSPEPAAAPPEEKAAKVVKVVHAAPEKKVAPPPTVAEQSILDEILEKFGNVLDIRVKLVTETGAAEFDPDEEDDDEEEIVPMQEAVTPSVVTIVPESVPIKGDRYEILHDPSIIEEIIEKFGNVLDVRTKLIPETGGSLDLYDEEDEEEIEEEELHEAPASAPPPQKPFVPIPLPFTAYAALIQQVRGFQIAKDNSGYTAWLGRSTPETKVVIRLKTLLGKEQRGEGMEWHGEYIRIASMLRVQPAAIQDLKTRIQKFDAIQTLLGALATQVKQTDSATIQAMKQIWSPLKGVFDDPAGSEILRSRLQMVVLQVTDPVLRSAILTLLAPVLEKAGKIFESD